jgi:hypothetical protein
VVVVDGAVVDVTVVAGTRVVVVGADVVEVAVVVLVGDVSVVVGEVVVANGDETAVACPVVEQATISSRDPTINRIGIP